jgi:DNA-directed RNA polymerase specialized sigma24 family protein
MSLSYRQRGLALQPDEAAAHNACGLNWIAERTQAETAAILGVSRQAVQQDERRALRKIRKAFASEIQERKNEG